MFFLLSKFFAGLYNPLLWVLIAVFFYMRARAPRLRRRAKRTAIFMLLIATNPLLLHTILRSWETPLSSIPSNETYDVCIVLGGYTNSQGSDKAYLSFNDRGNRLFAPLRLYQMGKVRNLLISGGSGEMLLKEEPEAISVGRYLHDMGLPDSTVWLEPNSRNTRENALFSAKMIKEKMPNAKILLVTSASHMPRASACFSKVGLKHTVYAVDQMGLPPSLKPSDWLWPETKAFNFWSAIIKEWLGIFAYKMFGYV